MSTPAGWHRQPDGQERYWDGQQWTDQYREGSASAAPSPAPAKKSGGCLKWVLIAIAALVLIGVLVTLLGGGDDEASPSSSGDTSQSTEDSDSSGDAAAEPALEVTAQQLIDDLEANALAASNTYKDKRITVTGKVENIDASGDYFTITGTEDFTFTSIRIEIDESFLETVSGFSTDQDVTVTGVVTGVGEVLGYEIEAESIG